MKAKMHLIGKCPGCAARYSEPVIVYERGRNWSVPAYCETCRPKYSGFLKDVDDVLETYKPIQEEIMEGWKDGDHKRSGAHRVANKPRSTRLQVEAKHIGKMD